MLASHFRFTICLTCFLTLRPHLALADGDYPERAQDEILTEAVLRLEGFDLDSSEKAKAAVLRYVEHNAGSERFFELVRRYRLPEAASLLLNLAIERPTDTQGVEAARLLLSQYGEASVVDALAKSGENAEHLVTALGLASDRRVVGLLLPLIVDSEQNAAVRTAAARAIGRQREGEKKLLELVQAGKLPDELKFTVANVLHASADEPTRAAAAELLPLPAAANAVPIPPLADLVEMRGDARHGREVFRTVGTCANCHTVGGEGKEVGPDLTEIGDKLSREAMFVSILDPSAGISHNYETYQAVLDTGTFFSGIKLSETDEAVTLKSAEAIVRTIPREQIEEFTKQEISLMPAELQKVMTVQQLVDVVEYLETLKQRTDDNAANSASAEGGPL